MMVKRMVLIERVMMNGGRWLEKKEQVEIGECSRQASAARHAVQFVSKQTIANATNFERAAISDKVAASTLFQEQESKGKGDNVIIFLPCNRSCLLFVVKMCGEEVMLCSGCQFWHDHNK